MKKIIGMLFCFLLFFLVLALSTIITSSQTHPELLVLCPSEANEDSVFLVTVKSGTIFITNATVTFKGETTLTNATGKVTFQAPRVVPDVNNTFTITASKEGYNTMSCFITILNVPQLFPTIPSTYLTENTTLVVTVVDEQGRPIKNATITYENKEYQTDENGTLTLRTPLVRKSETYKIIASKSGYLSNMFPIVVSPRPSQENLLGFLILLAMCCGIVVISIVLVVSKSLKRRRINRR
jgi:hypothetical protein